MKVANINDIFAAEFNQRADAIEAERQARLERRKAEARAARELAEKQERLHAAITKLKRRSGPPAILDGYARERIAGYRKDGTPVAMIALYLQISKTSVRRIMCEEGIE